MLKDALNNLNVGVVAMQIRIPEDMFDEYPDAEGKGWKVDVKGVKLFFDYRFSNPDEGLTSGLYLSYEEMELQRSGSSSTMWQLGEALRVGYVWRPSDGGFYFMPALAFLNSHRVSGNNEVRGEKFDADFTGFQPSINLGYSF